MNTGPRYRHVCGRCRYLGTYRAHDLYFCEQGVFPTLIARFGDDGPEYVSGMALAAHDPILAHALGILEVGEETDWISAVPPSPEALWARSCTELVEAMLHARRRAEVWKRVAKRIWTRCVPDTVGRYGSAARDIRVRRHLR